MFSERVKQEETFGSPEYQAALYAIANSETKDYIYLRRYSSEAAAKTAIGGDAVNLDKATTGHVGGNYPTFDIASSTEISSVKTHWSINGDLSETAINSYLSDFHFILGWNREVNALYKDGENIIRAKENGVPVPNEVRSLSAEGAAVYLRDFGTLRVPDDHVQQIRSALALKVRTAPANYFLSETFTEDQVERVVNRVRGIGVTSTELQQMLLISKDS